MTIRFDRPVSLASRIARRMGAFALVLCLAVLLAHRFGPLETPYFVLLMMAAGVFAALAVGFAAIGLRSLWVFGAEGGRHALKAIVYAALPLVIIGFALEHYITRPAIYDVSTDTTDVPAWLKAPDANQIWLPRNPDTSAQDREMQLEAYPALTGRRYEGAIDRVLHAVRKVAAENRITIIGTEGLEGAEPEAEEPVTPQPSEGAVSDAPETVPVPSPRPYNDAIAELIRRSTKGGLLQGETRTLVLGLHFDIMIRLREEAETTLVDMRVASRYGQHDLGFSAMIAEEYLRALDAELLGIAGG
ncbi:DUF1499 domain-containing protein [Rhizobium sp. BK251]|uniref:DUF1499 domain-containing protein n=1 Tax=Rhizobium sp. BK251 TaxID=2512125 RepID=UPI0010525D98|nr:DUF1499 domain-containing protein [Rhizobium sp. BK251]TCL75971.1 uncharacterized protein DUF1499 [Rhizobium sp. BK251]